MTTPITLEERVTILETRLDTILPTLATKEDIARLDGSINALEERLDGKIDALEGRLDGKIDALEGRLNGKVDALEERFNGKIDATNGRIDALENRLLLKFAALLIPVMGIVVAVVKYL